MTSRQVDRIDANRPAHDWTGSYNNANAGSWKPSKKVTALTNLIFYGDSVITKGTHRKAQQLVLFFLIYYSSCVSICVSRKKNPEEVHWFTIRVR